MRTYTSREGVMSCQSMTYLAISGTVTLPDRGIPEGLDSLGRGRLERTYVSTEGVML